MPRLNRHPRQYPPGRGPLLWEVFTLPAGVPHPLQREAVRLYRDHRSSAQMALEGSDAQRG